MGKRKDSLLTLEAVTTGYLVKRGARAVTKNIQTSLKPGEMVCLLGPNGAGKSTLMRTIAGMQPALSGQVLVNGRDVNKIAIRELAQLVSVVLTDRANTGMMTSYALVALGRHPHTSWFGRLGEADHAIIRSSMEMTGAANLADRMVTELSDGERQRVMVARALAQETPIMVLDEITAFLDLPRRVEMMGMLRSLAHDTGRAMLLSTHDLDLALRTADRVWLLPKDGDLTVGAPEDLILSGVFESAFASEGMEFERETGSFRIRRKVRGRIFVTGDGLRVLWTTRALERAGYLSGDPMSPQKVLVEEAGAWLVGTGNRDFYHSIEELIDALNRAMRGQ
jgi:iron complex transport system ATP-binding protein